MDVASSEYLKIQGGFALGIDRSRNDTEQGWRDGSVVKWWLILWRIQALRLGGSQLPVTLAQGDWCPLPASMHPYTCSILTPILKINVFKVTPDAKRV